MVGHAVVWPGSELQVSDVPILRLASLNDDATVATVGRGEFSASRYLLYPERANRVVGKLERFQVSHLHQSIRVAAPIRPVLVTLDPRPLFELRQHHHCP